ncbi:MAG: prepilin peptidase [Chloroflexi bacterium]|nr:prepilin peptidase [Chloroflexota bacterium]
MDLLLILLFALLGLFVGSFLNVCIDRLPRGQSIISPPSHCPVCNRKLGVLDLIPVLSYLWLRGRCRSCRAPIPFRLPLVEGVTAFLFALLYSKLGLGLELAAFFVYVSFLVVIFVIDLEHQLVLDKISYPGMIVAFILSFFRPGIRTFSVFWPGLGIESALLGGALGLVVLALIVIVSRGGMGWGDVKMAALVGLMTGFPLVIVALLLSWIGGGLVAAVLLTLRLKGRKDLLPFGTFLAVSALVTLLWGQSIWQWYWR